MRLRQSDYHQRRARAPFTLPVSRGDVAGGESRSANAAPATGRSMDPAAARSTFGIFGPAVWPAPARPRVAVGREVVRALAWLAALALVTVALVLWGPTP